MNKILLYSTKIMLIRPIYSTKRRKPQLMLRFSLLYFAYAMGIFEINWKSKLIKKKPTIENTTPKIAEIRPTMESLSKYPRFTLDNIAAPTAKSPSIKPTRGTKRANKTDSTARTKEITDQVRFVGFFVITFLNAYFSSDSAVSDVFLISSLNSLFITFLIFLIYPIVAHFLKIINALVKKVELLSR